MIEHFTDAMTRPVETWMILITGGVLYINQLLIRSDLKDLSRR